MSDDLIQPERKVIARIEVELIEGTGVNINVPAWGDEVTMLGLIDKLHSSLVDYYRMENAKAMAARAQAEAPRISLSQNGVMNALRRRAN